MVRMSQKLRVAVIGASGYTGEELLRILLRHPDIDLVAVTSRQLDKISVADSLGLAPGTTTLQFSNPPLDTLADMADIFFLALPHGVAAEFAVPLHAKGKTIFDLSADFRLKSPSIYKEYYGHDHPAPNLLDVSVYGNPELHPEAIELAQLIACPGCYPTSILLALAPAIKSGNIIRHESIVIHSLSGVSGAGKKADLSLLFCECNESLRAYGVPKHRHLSEIEQELSSLAGAEIKVSFTPHLVPVTRGMHTSIHTSAHPRWDKDTEALRALYLDFYRESPFVRILPAGKLPDTRHVVRTNRCDIGLEFDPRTGSLLFFSVIDNLGKGAAGQAVQCMNLKFGFHPEKGIDA